ASRPSSSSVRPSSSSPSFPPSENVVGGAEHARAQPLPRTIESAIRAVKEAAARSAAILRSEIEFTNSEKKICKSLRAARGAALCAGRPAGSAARAGWRKPVAEAIGLPLE
ncbi:MAG TPA: hypothetical protein VE964_05420, partial [Myxococcales bacterium]|nr:hypothetical protein [Myxococcales bacterium]